MKKLTREDLLLYLPEIQWHQQLQDALPDYLYQYVDALDIEMVQQLIRAGATLTNRTNTSQCLLFDLLHRYQSQHALHGQKILHIMQLVLESGIDTNQICQNNLRAYDYARHWQVTPMIQLLEKYGADRQLREPV